MNKVNYRGETSLFYDRQWQNWEWHKQMERFSMFMNSKYTGKMCKVSKAIYTFNAIPMKIAIASFTELEQIILKFIWKHKRPWIAKEILIELMKLEGPQYQIWRQCKIAVLRTLWCWHKTRCTDQWNRKENHEMYHKLYSQLISDMGQELAMGKKRSLQQMVQEKLDSKKPKNKTGQLS